MNIKLKEGQLLSFKAYTNEEIMSFEIEKVHDAGNSIEITGKITSRIDIYNAHNHIGTIKIKKENNGSSTNFRI